MITTLLFDVFGVLYPDTYNEFAAKYASQLSEENAERLYELHTQTNRGRIPLKDAVEEMAQLAGLDKATIYYELYEKEQVNTDLIGLIKKLHPTYKVGILSNVGSGFMERFLEQNDLKACFDAITLSCEIGYVKPELESYLRGAEALGTPVEHCLMIDDKQRNIDGALAIDMPSLLYENFPQFRKNLEKCLAPNEV